MGLAGGTPLCIQVPQEPGDLGNRGDADSPPRNRESRGWIRNYHHAVFPPAHLMLNLPSLPGAQHEAPGPLVSREGRRSGQDDRCGVQRPSLPCSCFTPNRGGSITDSPEKNPVGAAGEGKPATGITRSTTGVALVCALPTCTLCLQLNHFGWKIPSRSSPSVNPTLALTHIPENLIYTSFLCMLQTAFSRPFCIVPLHVQPPWV